MAAKPLPDAELLRKLLRYDPETGKLYWRERTPDMFTAGAKLTQEQLCKGWNGKNAGKQAFNSRTGLGYRTGNIFGVGFRAHRVIWKIVTGDEPDIIDHINGDGSDNRWLNLRDGTRSQNQRNQRRRTDNASGCTGVFFYKRLKKGRAYMTVGGKQVGLGDYHLLEDAIRARKAAERKYGFHPNHGRAA